MAPLILYGDDEQRAAAVAARDAYQKLLSKAGYGAIVTEIKPLEKFHAAEEYHQDYLVKNPHGYCPNHATGVRFATHAAGATDAIDNQALLNGKRSWCWKPSTATIARASERCPPMPMPAACPLNFHDASGPEVSRSRPRPGPRPHRVIHR
ncbi:MAG: peptide-methionine (S)-S-oxide reductase [Proteobacteria bacterium]|nr:peptide-methionine (S)-S-oxide reductase [Pseudomonadota bacterium]